MIYVSLITKHCMLPTTSLMLGFWRCLLPPRNNGIGMAPRQAALIHASLKQLQQALAQKGIPLYCHQCDDFAASIDWLTDYCAQSSR